MIIIINLRRDIIKRKTEKDYHGLAESRGFKWIGGVLPKGTHGSTLWECGKGDKWEARYQDIRQGSGCPVCSGLVRKTEKDYYNLAKSCGFKWIGGVLPKNTHTKTLWECRKTHCWEAEYSNIKKGTGCPICNVELLRNTESDYHRVVENRRIIWFGTELPRNANTKTKWKCLKCNYVWEACYGDIYCGSGCPFCSNRIPKTKKDYLIKIVRNPGFGKKDIAHIENMLKHKLGKKINIQFEYLNKIYPESSGKYLYTKSYVK